MNGSLIKRLLLTAFVHSTFSRGVITEEEVAEELIKALVKAIKPMAEGGGDANYEEHLRPILIDGIVTYRAKVGMIMQSQAQSCKRRCFSLFVLLSAAAGLAGVPTLTVLLAKAQKKIKVLEAEKDGCKDASKVVG